MIDLKSKNDPSSSGMYSQTGWNLTKAIKLRLWKKLEIKENLEEESNTF